MSQQMHETLSMPLYTLYNPPYACLNLKENGTEKIVSSFFFFFFLYRLQ